MPSTKALVIGFATASAAIIAATAAVVAATVTAAADPEDLASRAGSYDAEPTPSPTAPGPNQRYWVLNTFTGLCLDLPGYVNDPVALGTPVAQFTCNVDDNQEWALVAHGADAAGVPKYLIRNEVTKTCLDLPGAGVPAAGDQVSVWDCLPDGDNQLWRIEPSAADTYRIINDASNLCLDVPGDRDPNSRNPDVALDVHYCKPSGQDDHDWRFSTSRPPA